MREAVAFEFCGYLRACGESILAAAESSRVSAAMLEFNKQVNASMALGELGAPLNIYIALRS